MRWLEEIGSGDLAKNRELIAALNRLPIRDPVRHPAPPVIFVKRPFMVFEHMDH